MEGTLEKEVHSIHLNFWVESQLFLSFWQRKEPISILFRGLTGTFRIMTEKYVVWLLSCNSVGSYFWRKMERCLAIQIAPLPGFLFPHLWVGILLDCEPRELQGEGGSQIMCRQVCVKVRFRQETQGSKNAASLCNDMNGNYKWNFHQGFATLGAIYYWYPKMGHQDHFKKVERPQVSVTT